MKKHFSAIVILSFVLIAFLMSGGGCKKKGALPEGNHLRIHLGTEPPSLDPTLTDSVVSFKIIDNILEGLLEYNEKLEPVPAVASSWNISPDGKRYTFQLKEWKWTDGRNVTADDFVFAFQKALSPATLAPAAPLLFSIRGATLYKVGKTTDWNQVGVRVLDSSTLEIELENPEPSFLHVLAQPVAFPQRRDVVEALGDRAWLEPAKMVTNGPFLLREWRHDARIELVRNPSYSGKAPSLEQISALIVSELKTAHTLYERGEIDILEQFPPFVMKDYEKNPQFKVFPDFSTYFVAFNTKKPPFNDARVRRAFAGAIRKDDIVRLVEGGIRPAGSFVPPGIEGHNGVLHVSLHEKEARDLLRQAGYGDQPGGKSLPPLTLGFNTNERHQLIMEWLQQQWKERLGVRVELQNREWKSYLDWLQSDPPHLFRYAWLAAIPDALAHLTLFESSNPSNFGKWFNPEYDSLTLEIRRMGLLPQRKELIDRAQKLLIETEVALIPIYFYVRPILVKPHVQGLRVTGRGVLGYKSVSVARE